MESIKIDEEKNTGEEAEKNKKYSQDLKAGLKAVFGDDEAGKLLNGKENFEEVLETIRKEKDLFKKFIDTALDVSFNDRDKYMLFKVLKELADYLYDTGFNVFSLQSNILGFDNVNEFYKKLRENYKDQSTGKVIDIINKYYDGQLTVSGLLILLEIELSSKATHIKFNACIWQVGTLYAMELGRSLISTGKYKNALLVATDTNSKFVDWQDRSTCVLFGDGAASMILEEAKDGIDDIIAIDIHADGSVGKNITLNLIGDNCPLVEPSTNGSKKITMNGREVYKFVMHTMPESIMNSLKNADMNSEDIDYLVPHQANYRIIEGLQSRLEFSDDKVIVNIDKYGNTSAASVPIALLEGIETGKIKTPSKAILCAFGAGMTWGSAIVRLREGIV